VITRQDLENAKHGQLFEGEAEPPRSNELLWFLFEVDSVGEGLEEELERQDLVLVDEALQTPQLDDEEHGQDKTIDDLDASLAYLNQGGLLLYIADEPDSKYGRFVAVVREGDYSWVTDDMFRDKLEEIMDRGLASDLLTIPGVYEACYEHFNNEVLDELEAERE